MPAPFAVVGGQSERAAARSRWPGTQAALSRARAPLTDCRLGQLDEIVAVRADRSPPHPRRTPAQSRIAHPPQSASAAPLRGPLCRSGLYRPLVWGFPATVVVLQPPPASALDAADLIPLP